MSVCCAMYLVQNLYCLPRIMQFPFAVELPSFIVRLRISFVPHTQDMPFQTGASYTWVLCSSYISVCFCYDFGAITSFT